jgi:dTDP-4-amino-4,6-dideoxygalactose transaminase
MQNSYYCLAMGLDDQAASLRFEIVDQLNKRGVGTSIYYPRPVPHMSYYRTKYGYATDSFPNAAWISHNSIALPVGPHLDLEDMAYIAEMAADTVQELVR